MRQYDANPGLSAFAVVVGAVLGLVAAALLGVGGLGYIVLALLGVAAAGVVVSTLGIVGERDRGDRGSDLPSHYDDY